MAGAKLLLSRRMPVDAGRSGEDHGLLDKLERFAATATQERPLAYKLVFGTVAFGIAFALRYVLNPYLPPGFPFLTFFPAMIVTAFICGGRAGAAVAAFSAVAAWYFFIDPLHSFRMTGGAAVALGFFLFIACVDIAIIHLMRNAMRKADSERGRTELMFREAQHRISNNLSVVASLLRLQKTETEDLRTRQVLDEAANRTAVVGRIQRRILHADGATIGTGPLLRELVEDSLRAAGDDKRISFTATTQDDVFLPHEKIVPLALIVTELAANALEHAWESGRPGRMNLEVRRDGRDRIVVEISDDGSGVPEGFNMADAKSVGLRIVHQFVRQLGGTIAVVNAPGARWTLVLPAA